jgi:DnaK suppressor protein
MTGQPTPEQRQLEAGRLDARRRLAALEREFDGIVESASQSGIDDEHDPEGATIAFERQHVMALIDQAHDHLAEIEAALSRLSEGTYGTCERCGEPIGTDRLTARPVALTCIRCAARK